MSVRLILALLAAGALQATARAEGYQRYLPADTRAAFVFNVTALDDEQQKAGAEFVRQLYSSQLVPELKKLDRIPISDLKQVVVVQPFLGSVNLFNLTPSGAAALVLLRGKVDGALLDKQMREAAKQSNGAIKVESLGKPAASVYSRKVDEKALRAALPPLDQLTAEQRQLAVPRTMRVAALDTETLVVSFMGRPAIERVLRARPAKTKPRVSAEMAKLLAGLDERDAASAALAEGKDGLYPGLQLLAPKEILDWFTPLKNAVAAVRLGKGLKLTLTARGQSDEDAQKLEKVTAAAAKAADEALPDGLDEQQRQAVKKLRASLKISRKADVVTVTAELSEEEWKKLQAAPKK
jgi:hypothetical protein